ncbi:MAG: sensor histidine kinase [Deltaproteobacteria bacterium]|nr:sensor histidine kinase [Deltaproteobacteria bacterium]
MKLRTHLIILVIASLLPVLLFASAMIYVLSTQQRAVVERGLMDTARALSLAVDHELDASITTLQALATSEYLDNGDLGKFYEQVRRVQKDHGNWTNILLISPTGQQLINLRRPFGAPLPPAAARDSLKQTIETRQPAVSSLFVSRISGAKLLSVEVPVVRNGKVLYSLAASISPELLGRILLHQKIPANWIGTIIDKNKNIIARTRSLEQFLGKPTTPRFAAMSRAAEEAVWQDVTHDGIPVHAAFHRSALSGWSVGLAIPASEVIAPVRRSLRMTVVGGVVLFIGAFGLALVFGRRIARPIAALSSAAAALGRGGKTPQIDASPIVEVNEVARAIEAASASRQRAEEQTQRNLDRIRALHEIDLAITSTLELGTILDLLLEKIDLLLPHRVITAVRLLNTQTGILEPITCRNIDKKEWLAKMLEFGDRKDSVARMLVETKAPIVVSRIATDPRTRHFGYVMEHGAVSFLGLPLIAKGEVVGSLSLYGKKEHEFSESEVEFLSTLAGQAAVAINNSQLYEETKKQAAELEKSNRIKSEFLSVMSHELRTPLTAIVGYTSLIQERILGGIEAEKALDKIIKHAEDLLNMINTILQATSLEAGEVRVTPAELHPTKLLDDIKSSYDFAPKKGVNLQWDYSEDLPAITTDVAKLKHILQNLISNAIKFTEKGTVTISARMTEGKFSVLSSQFSVEKPQTGPTGGDGTKQGVETQDPKLNTQNSQQGVDFRVSDTGVGIPKESLPVIFEMFRQADSSETRRYGGVGLGLYIVRNYTELLGGTVQVESVAGSGSTFTVRLPCEWHNAVSP